LAFCIERVAAVEFLFEGLPADCAIPLVTLPTIFPRALQAYPGPVLLMHQEGSFSQWLEPEATAFQFGATVATMIYRALVYFGCTQICLLGQDLAYDRVTGSSHVAGVSQQVREAEEALAETGAFCELIGNDGKPVPSNVFWRFFAENFRHLIALLGVPCYNVMPQDRGARISGAIRVEPQEFWRQQTQGFQPWQAASVVAAVLAKQKQSQRGQYIENLLASTESMLSSRLKDLQTLIEDITRTYHEQMPLSGSEQEWTDYQKYIAAWLVRENEILHAKNSAQEVFLNLFFRAPRLTYVRARESLVYQPGQMIDYVSRYIQITQFLLKDVWYWTARARECLSAAKAQEK
jgi:hypothetical protein